MSFISFTYHIIWRTKYSELTINQEYEKELYKYIYGMCKNMKCYLHRINSMPNHVHMCVEIHPTISVSSFMQRIKQETSKWIKEHQEWFPDFTYWGERYAAFTYSKSQRPTIINYIKNQKEHHRSIDLEDEIKQIFHKYNMDDEVEDFLKD